MKVKGRSLVPNPPERIMAFILGVTVVVLVADMTNEKKTKMKMK